MWLFVMFSTVLDSSGLYCTMCTSCTRLFKTYPFLSVTTRWLLVMFSTVLVSPFQYCTLCTVSKCSVRCCTSVHHVRTVQACIGVPCHITWLLDRFSTVPVSLVLYHTSCTPRKLIPNPVLSHHVSSWNPPPTHVNMWTHDLSCPVPSRDFLEKLVLAVHHVRYVKTSPLVSTVHYVLVSSLVQPCHLPVQRTVS